MVHRTIYGSLERFIGVLTEHLGGAFPTWLLAGLRGAADNSPRNKVVTPEEIFSYVKNGLDELSGRTGKEQHPKMKYNDKKMPVIKLK